MLECVWTLADEEDEDEDGVCSACQLTAPCWQAGPERGGEGLGLVDGER